MNDQSQKIEKTNGPIHIAFCVNETYISYLSVAIWSILNNLEPSNEVKFHIIEINLSKKHKKKTSRILNIFPKINSQIYWYEPILSFDNSFGKDGFSALSRLNLPLLMPKEIRKILYLDVDIFVLKNIVELWETDLSNKTLLAVKDPHINKISSPEGLNYALRYYNLNPEAPYFNSGVLLLNLTKMLQDNFIEKCKKHLDNKNFRNNFWDQDVLNIFAYNDWLPLELKWNFPLPLLLTELNHSNNISINDGAHLVENNLVGIIHFTILKPTLGFPFHFYLIFWLFGNNRNINRIERRATFGFIFRFHYLYYLSLLKNNWVTPLKLSQEIIKYIISSFKNLFFRTPFEIWDLLKK